MKSVSKKIVVVDDDDDGDYNCVRRRRTLPYLACLLLTLAKALRAFWAIGRAVMTSNSRCAKDSASCDTKFCLLREHWVLASVLADVLLIS